MNPRATDSSSKPLHIALVISSLHGGGAERIILTLAQGMIERGHRVDLVLFNMRIHYPEGIRESIRKETGIPEDMLTTIYNPVVSPELDRLKWQAPDHPWFTDQAIPIILACGRFKQIKGFPVLIKAFARLSGQRQCRLIILGEGEQRRQLESLVASLNLRQKVSLPGWVDNPPKKQNLLDWAAFFSVERSVGKYKELILEIVRQRRVIAQ